MVFVAVIGVNGQAANSGHIEHMCDHITFYKKLAGILNNAPSMFNNFIYTPNIQREDN